MIENSIFNLINKGTSMLTGIDSARLDSELILSKVLKKNKLYLLTHKDEIVSDEEAKEYFEYINLRQDRMPVKYILNECDFYGLDFYIEEGVLIPRSDTEVLVSEVISCINNSPLKNNQEIEVCDLCSGSGAIGISIAHNIKNSIVDEIDYYDKPMEVTKINILKNKLGDRVKFIKSNLLAEVIGKKKYDILVSNPPYIRREEIGNLMKDVKDFEPNEALDGGDDGLHFYKQIIKDSKKVLKPNGVLAFEIGYDQAEDVKKMMIANGYKDVFVKKDLAMHDRVVMGFLE